MRFKDKRVLVIGAGQSGKSAEAFLQQRGALTYLFDDNDGLEHEWDSQDFDLAVLSPGVSINHPLAQKFKDILLSELALGFMAKKWWHRKKVVTITGTNGKTSVVNMIFNALGAGRAVLCGNCGPPVTAVTREIQKKIPVTEISSFMLELPAPRSNIAVILNVTEDHLDRHGTVENYVAHKESLAKSQKRRDTLILNYDCVTTRGLAIGKRQRVLWFSTTTRVRGIYVENGVVYLNIARRRKPMVTLNELGIWRTHDIQNLLATVLVCKLLGAKKVGWNNAPEHRLQFVKTVGQTSFYNDSKATNIAATLAAASSFSLPVHLILGGQGKGQDFAKLFNELPVGVASIHVFGADAHTILTAASESGYKHAFYCSSLEHATHAAYESAKATNGPTVVLLSPACASLDSFTSYAERGEIFKRKVMNIHGNVEVREQIKEEAGEKDF